MVNDFVLRRTLTLADELTSEADKESTGENKAASLVLSLPLRRCERNAIGCSQQVFQRGNALIFRCGTIIIHFIAIDAFRDETRCSRRRIIPSIPFVVTIPSSRIVVEFPENVAMSSSFAAFASGLHHEFIRVPNTR